MKIVQINSTCGIGSTGKICVDISEMLTNSGIENYILYTGKTNGYEFGIGCASKKYIHLQSLKSHLFGNYGFNSNKSTKKIINELERINPDIVHLHNIHSHDCNLEILFKYFKFKKVKLIWTFHDCWAFTGYCTHFTMAKCDKWMFGCEKCPQYKEYSFFIDKSKSIYHKKKKLFSNLDMTIVTPSKWLANLLKESFLKYYDVKVINNGIDLNIFKPTNSNFRKQYNISKKKNILLGVSFDWGIRKGLDIFIELANILDYNKYQIVLVGTNDSIDRQLPSNIISIHRTQNQNELAKIYTVADWFINPTREENYPTVNMEAIACGTPVITFNTGGSAEMLGNCGMVVKCNEIDRLVKIIKEYDARNGFSCVSCQKKATEYDKECKYEKYINLYRSVYE